MYVCMYVYIHVCIYIYIRVKKPSSGMDMPCYVPLRPVEPKLAGRHLPSLLIQALIREFRVVGKGFRVTGVIHEFRVVGKGFRVTGVIQEFSVVGKGFTVTGVCTPCWMSSKPEQAIPHVASRSLKLGPISKSEASCRACSPATLIECIA